MKKFTFYVLILFFFVLTCLFRLPAFSQISVVSTTGYSVNISVTPVSIVPSSNSCVYGYNYNVKLNYNITITGNNKPASLYTLQGTLGCTGASHFFDLPNNGGSGSVTSGSYQWSSVSDCATATVISKHCSTVNIEIYGPGISNRIVSFTPSTPLEIQLLSFSAKPELNKVKIDWSTASETDNAFFTIEKSTDGTKWDAVKEVKGAGNSTNLTTYQVYDEAPVNGTVYYRLKQTDIDGKFSFSSIQAVTYKAATNGISIFPIPNTGNTINLSGIIDYRNNDLAVVSASGAVIYKTAITKTSIELPNLKAGLYILRVTNHATGEITNLRYVKI